MKSKLLFSLMLIMPFIPAYAAIPYRAQQDILPLEYDTDDSFASAHRFYIGGAYDFSMWSNYTDDQGITVRGKNTSSYDAVLGMRITDIFRLEANYIRTRAKYNNFSFNGNTAMVNAIIDARIDSMYRLFYRQHLVPYIGVGGGASWLKSDAVHMQDKITPIVSAMAGLGLELGEHLTFDIGYRYMYTFSPQFDVISDFNPAANQFRAGIRINF